MNLEPVGEEITRTSPSGSIAFAFKSRVSPSGTVIEVKVAVEIGTEAKVEVAEVEVVEGETKAGPGEVVEVETEVALEEVVEVENKVDPEEVVEVETKVGPEAVVEVEETRMAWTSTRGPTFLLAESIEWCSLW